MIESSPSRKKYSSVCRCRAGQVNYALAQFQRKFMSVSAFRKAGVPYSDVPVPSERDFCPAV